MGAGSEPRQRTLVSGTQEPLIGEGGMDRGQSTPSGIGEQVNTRPDTKNSGGGGTGGGTILSRAPMVWTEGIVFLRGF